MNKQMETMRESGHHEWPVRKKLQH